MNLLKKCKYGMMIFNNSDIWVGRSLEKYGEFSESEVQLFRDAIKPGSIVLDIGANIGCHTLALCSIVGPIGCVLAYEPERHNFNTLAGNIALNNLHNVYLFHKAVGSSSGVIAVPELDLERTVNWGSLSLIDDDYSHGPSYPVFLTTIDQQNLCRVDFIKIDIEGMEKSALEGAKATISKCKPILYVENDREDKSEALVEFLKSLDYKLYTHYAPLYNPDNFNNNKEDVFFSTTPEGHINHIVSINLFCHHKDLPCPVDIQKFGMKEVE
jgi:FkbM family methyltransferase